MLLACGGGDSGPSSSDEAPPSPIAPVKAAKALQGATAAEVALEDGWGGVFWRQGQAWQVGGGTVLTTPTEARVVTTSGEPMICGGLAVKSAPARAALALPGGAPLPTFDRVPAIRAHLVERAAWRLDEVLPPRDRYSPAGSSSQPARQRGVHVGSVAKTRRHGAPPVLLTTGVRDCTAAVAVLDAKSEHILAYDRVGEVCETLRVLPATDLDGKPGREFAVFNDTVVVLYRMTERAGRVGLTRIGHWRCASEGGGE